MPVARKPRAVHVTAPQRQELGALLRRTSGATSRGAAQAVSTGRWATQQLITVSYGVNERLRTLKAEGWVHRHYEPTGPPQVTHSITDKVMERDGVLN